jgi:hypothetical protein
MMKRDGELYFTKNYSTKKYPLTIRVTAGSGKFARMLHYLSNKQDIGKILDMRFSFLAETDHDRGRLSLFPFLFIYLMRIFADLSNKPMEYHKPSISPI